MTSELSAPLIRRGLRAAKAARGGLSLRRLPIARLAFLGIFLIILGVVARVVLVETPEGGWPVAEVDIHAGSGAVSRHPRGIVDIGPEMPLGGGDSIIELGEEARGAGFDAETAMIPDRVTGIIPDLSEETEHGSIPRMSGTGERPFERYARPAPPVAGGVPRLGVLVTGLGINASSSMEAAAKLPANISMGFAPYGDKLRAVTASAREAGHELFLEVPLEPFDFPDNDPGPDTLLAGRPPRENLDKLFSVMASFGGYAGLVNNMGARFTASGADFGPVMEELGARGLGYLDDGSSNRSLAGQLAGANRVPYAKSDMMLDANPSRAMILAQLSALEELARSEGDALSVISALPISINTLAEWAETVESRGFQLVPASALMK
jgi:polysaccharide deacetylase 2 family uncharacterized protein YibQ